MRLINLFALSILTMASSNTRGYTSRSWYTIVFICVFAYLLHLESLLHLLQVFYKTSVLRFLPSSKWLFYGNSLNSTLSLEQLSYKLLLHTHTHFTHFPLFTYFLFLWQTTLTWYSYFYKELYAPFLKARYKLILLTHEHHIPTHRDKNWLKCKI